MKNPFKMFWRWFGREEDILDIGKNNLERMKSIDKDIERLCSEMREVQDRIGKNELMHVQVHKSAQDSYSKAMETLVNSASDFSKNFMKMHKEMMDELIAYLKPAQPPSMEDISPEYFEEKGEKEETKGILIHINGDEVKWMFPVIEYRSVIAIAQPFAQPFDDRMNGKVTVDYVSNQDSTPYVLEDGDEVAISAGMKFFVSVE